MKFQSLGQCLSFLDNENELIKIREPVDPYLEMAEITRQVFEAKGPALLFLNVRNCSFPAVSNLFGTYERTLKIFEPELQSVKALVDLRSDPGLCFRQPKKLLSAFSSLIHALPLKSLAPKVMENTCGVQDLPMIQCWPGDGGAFILLPQVFTRDPDHDSILRSNLGMYRIQISGNDYLPGREIGLHYQLHRGIGDHHKKALEKPQALKVSIFVGGPPAHTLAAIMPLPEKIPEIAFAGRSNVGKSSLINTLLNRKGLARTSNTPGRTQEINFFRVNERFAFIDLPGYGYAKVPEAIRKQWGPMVETYLRERDTLRLVVVILDVRRDPSAEDLQLMEWLQCYRIPFLICLTKTDKVSKNVFANRRRLIAEKIRFSREPALMAFSAKTGEGKELLWREIKKTMMPHPGDEV